MTKVNYLITDSTVTVNYQGETHTISRHETVAAEVVEALRQKDYDKVVNLMKATKRIEKYAGGLFTVEDNVVKVDDWELPSFLARKVLEFADQKLPCEPLVLFAKKLRHNVSFKVRRDLYSFLDKNNHPITDEGNFIAYKKVASDFKDIHSRTFDNSIGTVVSMDRSQVDDDPNNTCSHGLHVANYDYAANHYGSSSDDIMLEVEVDPADVVSIPTDYNQSKMRVCKYKVLGVVKQELSTSLRRTNSVVDSSDEDYEDEDYADEDYEDEDYADEDYTSDCENCTADCESCDNGCVYADDDDYEGCDNEPADDESSEIKYEVVVFYRGKTIKVPVEVDFYTKTSKTTTLLDDLNNVVLGAGAEFASEINSYGLLATDNVVSMEVHAGSLEQSEVNELVRRLKATISKY